MRGDGENVLTTAFLQYDNVSCLIQLGIKLMTSIDENVFLFVPNLIGYLRVVTAAASLYYMPIHPKACLLLYFVSCILDAVDGQAARALNQTSKFGAVLDMVTDRLAVAHIS